MKEKVNGFFPVVLSKPLRESEVREMTERIGRKADRHVVIMIGEVFTAAAEDEKSKRK